MDPSTASATIAAIVQSADQVNWVVPILESLLKYAPLLTLMTVIGAALISFGVFKQKFETIGSDMKKVLKSVGGLNECVDEIQTILRNKYRSMTLTKETISIYGKANSPIVLRDEFRPYVKDSGLDQEIEKRKTKLVEWLKSKKPKTGLDAQSYILDLVYSDKIDEIIDTKKFKDFLYKKGKIPQDFYVILAIYLFEIIIPEAIEKQS